MAHSQSGLLTLSRIWLRKCRIQGKIFQRQSRRRLSSDLFVCQPLYHSSCFTSYYLLTLLSNCRCFHLCHNSLLWYHRPRCSSEQQRLLPPGRSLRASYRKYRSHIWSIIYHLPILGAMLNRNLPHSWTHMVGSCTRQCSAFFWLLFQGG